jgi:hypothetical protein
VGWIVGVDDDTNIIVWQLPLNTYKTLMPANEFQEMNLYRFYGPVPNPAQSLLDTFQLRFKKVSNIIYQSDLSDILPSEILRLRLLSAKCQVLSVLVRGINWKRQTILGRDATNGAEYVHNHQLSEAQQYTQQISQEYPWLSQLCQIHNIQMDQAAKMVLFKDQEIQQGLLSTEFQLLTWKPRICACTTEQQILDMFIDMKAQAILSGDITLPPL